MPAEKANTTSLVTVRLSPTVLHAAGESFMPTRRRPNDPRRKAPDADAAQGEHDGEEHVEGTVGGEAHAEDVGPTHRTAPDCP